VLAMAHLTRNDVLCLGLSPQNIVIDKNGMVQIMSPALVADGDEVMV